MNRDAALASLVARRAEFTRFLAARLNGDTAAAEDLLQDGLAKALGRTDTLQDDTRLVAWFYQILRNTLVDHVRQHGAARQREAVWSTDPALQTAPDHATHTALCHCFESLLPLLKPTAAELIRRVELNGEPFNTVAADLELTPNNASVTLHRARRELHQRLLALCGDCTATACLDCDCESNESLQ